MKIWPQIMLMPYGQSGMTGCDVATILHALRAIGKRRNAYVLPYYMPPTNRGRLYGQIWLWKMDCRVAVKVANKLYVLLAMAKKVKNQNTA